MGSYISDQFDKAGAKGKYITSNCLTEGIIFRKVGGFYDGWKYLEENPNAVNLWDSEHLEISVDFCHIHDTLEEAKIKAKQMQQEAIDKLLIEIKRIACLEF